MSERSDLVVKLAEMATGLRGLIAEAHGVMKDLQHWTKEARVAVSGAVADHIDAEVREQLEKLGEVTKEQMAVAVAKVDAEFAKLAKLYLEGRGSKGEPLHDLALRAKGDRL